MAAYKGKCSQCKREYYANHADIVVCQCWKLCPLCSREMEPYTPDLAANTYGKDGRSDLLTLQVCNNTAEHPDYAPFFSKQKPVEVELR